MNTLIDLTARNHTSKVLTEWAQSRPGAAARMSNMQVGPVASSDVDAMKTLFAPISSASGFVVSDKTSMAVSAVYACLSRLGGAVLQLPVHQYRAGQDGQRERIRNSSLWWLLNEQPHARWTAASWKEWIVRCVALRGDQFTRIVRSGNQSGGQIIGLEPLHPEMVVVRRWVENGADRLVYDVTDMFAGTRRTVDQDDMLHFSGFGYDGLRSISAIQHAARQAVGNSLAASEYTGRTIGEGAMPQIALEYPNKFNKEQTQQLRDSFVAVYGGQGGRKLPLVLSEGGKVQQLSISPVDMQLIELRGLEENDICQVLGVPPVLIGKNEKTTSWGTGVEQITIGFVRYTVKPMLCRWEEELNRKFFRNAGQFVEFELDALLRGDSKAQTEAFRGALGGPGTGNGYRTQNEIRAMLNLPPDPDPASDSLFKAAAPAAPAPDPMKDPNATQ